MANKRQVFLQSFALTSNTKLTYEIDKRFTYHRLFLRFIDGAGADATIAQIAAQIGDVALKLGGFIERELNAVQLQSFEEHELGLNAGSLVANSNGYLTLNFESSDIENGEPAINPKTGAIENAYLKEATALGTLNFPDKITLEVNPLTLTVAITNVEIYAEVSENTPMGFIKQHLRTLIPSVAIGLNTIQNLTRGKILGYFIANSVLPTRGILKVDGSSIEFEGPRGLYDHASKIQGYKPVTNFFGIDFTRNKRLLDAKDVKSSNATLDLTFAATSTNVPIITKRLVKYEQTGNRAGFNDFSA
ncbi:MAG: hypothetical protein ACK5BE_07050 [Alphaproteobacteria bacterium]|jgi:hypothetical protein